MSIVSSSGITNGSGLVLGTGLVYGSGIVGGGSIGPLDLVPGAAAAYGLRRLRGNYTGYAVNVRRSSDNATQDIGFFNADFDVTAYSAFVGAASGFIAKWYDQSGNGNDAVQAVAAGQPEISLATIGTRPSLVGANDGRLLQTANLTIAQPFTISCVAERTSYSAGVGGKVMQADSSSVTFGWSTGAAADFTIYAGSFLTGTVSASAPHAIAAVFDGASSLIDTESGNVTSGDVGAGGFSASPIDIFFANNSLVGNQSELIVWAAGLTASQRASYTANAAAYFGF